MAAKLGTMLKGFLLCNGVEYGIVTYSTSFENRHVMEFITCVQNTLKSPFCAARFKIDATEHGLSIVVIARARDAFSQEKLQSMASSDVLALAAAYRGVKWAMVKPIPITSVIEKSPMPEDVYAYLSMRMLSIRKGKSGSIEVYKDGV